MAGIANVFIELKDIYGSSIDYKQVWQRLDELNVLQTIDSTKFKMQLQGLGEFNKLFDASEISSIDSAGSLIALSIPISSAVERKPASTMNAIYKALKLSAKIHGLERHDAIADKLIKIAEQIKIHNPGAHQSNHVPIPPSVQQTYSTSDIQGFYDKDIPLTTSSSQCSTLRPETSENSKSLPKISFDRKSKQIKLTHTILTAPQQSTSGTRFPQPSTSALKFFQESTVVPGSPQQSTVIPGSPQQSTVVPGSPQQSTVVPGSPQQSIPNQTSKGENTFRFLKHCVLTDTVPVSKVVLIASQLIKVDYRSALENAEYIEEPDTLRSTAIALIEKSLKNEECKMDLYEIFHIILKCGPELCKGAFHTSSSTLTEFQVLDVEDPVWKVLSRHLGTSWKIIAEYLGFTKTEVEEIEHNCSLLHDKLDQFRKGIRFPTKDKIKLKGLIISILHICSLYDVATAVESDPQWINGESAFSFIEKCILTPEVSIREYEELAKKLQVNQQDLAQICVAGQDKQEIKKASIMKLIREAITEMSLFTVTCKVVESGPKLCRTAFHKSNPHPMFISYECGNPLWKSLTVHLGVSWAQFAIRLGFTESEVKAIRARNPSSLDQQLLDFCKQIRFPKLSNNDAKRLLVHMLHYANLGNIAEVIVKDLDMSVNSSKKPAVPQWYQEAKEQQGFIVVLIIRCMFTGSPRVGKTSLKYILLNGKPRIIKTSTSMLEAPTVATIQEELVPVSFSEVYTTSGTIWQEADNVVMKSIISKAKIKTKQYPGLQPSVNGSETAKPLENTDLFEDRPKSRFTSSLSLSHDDSLIGNDPRSNDSTSSGTPHKDPLSILHEARQAFLEGSGETEQDIDLEKNVTFIYLLDTGGQPSFQDSLPMLIDFPCNFIHVFNASRKLTDPYINTYCQDGQNEDKPETENFQSSWEVMQQSLTAAHTMSFKYNRNFALFGGENPKPRIFLVGTNLSKLACSSSKQEILQHNIDIITEKANIQKPYNQFKENPENLYESCNAFFLVDNMLEGETEHSNKVFSELRSRISDKQSCVKIEVPKLWFCLQLITRNIEKKMWQYSDLKQFCIDCSYVQADNADSQFQALLRLLHSLGFYVYFNTQSTKPEDQWVCSDASFLYKEISKLFSIQFPSSSGSIQHEEFLFRKTGQISARISEKLFCQLKVHPSIPPLWLLNVLEHVGLASKVTGDDQSDRYFIPVVLPSKNLTGTLPESGSVANLAFTFQYHTEFKDIEGYSLPTGVFYRLVVDLASRQKSECKDIALQTWIKYPEKSDRMTVRFYSKKVQSTIYLIQREDRIELQLLIHDYSSPHQPVTMTTTSLHNLCFMIKKEMVERICTVSRTLFGDQFLGKKAEIAIGVPCTRPSCVKGNHLMLFLDERAAECLSTQKKTGLLPSQSVWMKKKPDHDVNLERYEFEEEVFFKYSDQFESGTVATGVTSLSSSSNRNQYQPGVSQAKKTEHKEIDSFSEEITEDRHSTVIEQPQKPALIIYDRVRAEEDDLLKSCWFPFGIHDLQVEPEGGDFSLDNGDTWLEIPRGAFEEKIFIQYGIALHGPWQLPEGYTICSVTVYLNLLGKMPKKELTLHLSNWYGGEKSNILRFTRASHMCQKCNFQFTLLKEGEDFSHARKGSLKIADGKYLYCTVLEKESDDNLSYQVLPVNISEQQCDRFLLLFTYDSPNWLKYLKTLYPETDSTRGRKRKYCFQKCPNVGVSVEISKSEGPGWEAELEGAEALDMKRLDLSKKSVRTLKEELKDRDYPPLMECSVLYNYPKEMLTKYTRITLSLKGINPELKINCNIKEESIAIDQGGRSSLVNSSSQQLSDSSFSNKPQTPLESTHKGQFISGRLSSISGSSIALNSEPESRLDTVPSDNDLQTYIANRCPTQWQSIGNLLGLENEYLDGIRRNTTLKSEIEKCFGMLVLWKQAKSSGENTWRVLLEALKEENNCRLVVEELEIFLNH